MMRGVDAGERGPEAVRLDLRCALCVFSQMCAHDFQGHTLTRMLDGLCVCVCARPYLIRVYVHPTPVAAEIILRHTAYFFFF